MKPLLATIFRVDDWVLDRVFQPLVEHSPDPIRVKPAILAMLALMGSSTYMLVCLLLLWMHLSDPPTLDWPRLVKSGGICFVGTCVFFMIARAIAEDQRPGSPNWFRQSGQIVRYALLAVSIITLYRWVWYSGVIWLWWIAACLMACYPMPPRLIS